MACAHHVHVVLAELERDLTARTARTLVTSSGQSRPELAALDKQIAAAEANYQAAAYGSHPSLSATASTQWSPDTSDATPEPTWSAGLTLSWQLFDGGRAKAERRREPRQRSGLRRGRHRRAPSSQLAEARYTQGLGTQIELADAQTAITTAEGNLVQAQCVQAQWQLAEAQWQLAEAWTQLRRAIGAPRK